MRRRIAVGVRRREIAQPKASVPRVCLDAPILHRTTLICFPQRLRLDEGHFRLVAPMRLEPIQPKFQISDARRIGLARQRLDKVGPRRQAGSHEKFVKQPVLPGSIYRPV
jgi:hypothetical protein